jgi:hypothetical protein
MFCQELRWRETFEGILFGHRPSSPTCGIINFSVAVLLPLAA